MNLSHWRWSDVKDHGGGEIEIGNWPVGEIINREMEIALDIRKPSVNNGLNDFITVL